MKANEFIKKYGITRAHQILKYSNYKHKRFLADRISVTYNEMDIPDWTSIDDLKRLVESHGLIESCGGLDAAKHELITLQKHLNNTFGWVTVITSEKIDRLKQAIFDVESCHVD